MIRRHYFYRIESTDGHSQYIVGVVQTISFRADPVAALNVAVAKVSKRLNIPEKELKVLEFNKV